MEFSNVNIIRLSDGSGEKPKLHVLHNFDYQDDEYICVRKLNNAEDMPYGNCFFMKVIKGIDGHRGCKRIGDIETADKLRQEVGSTTFLREKFGEKMPNVTVMYDFKHEKKKDLLINETRYTYLRRKPNGKIGCDRLGERVNRYSEWIKSEHGRSIIEKLLKNRQKISVLYETMHNGQQYYYLREKSCKAESWYFSHVEKKENGRAIHERVRNETLAEALWSKTIREITAPKIPLNTE